MLHVKSSPKGNDEQFDRSSETRQYSGNKIEYTELRFFLKDYFETYDQASHGWGNVADLLLLSIRTLHVIQVDYYLTSLDY
jgi:hypothetical protein